MDKESIDYLLNLFDIMTEPAEQSKASKLMVCFLGLKK